MCECVVGDLSCVVVWFGLCDFLVAACDCVLVLNRHYVCGVCTI